MKKLILLGLISSLLFGESILQQLNTEEVRGIAPDYVFNTVIDYNSGVQNGPAENWEFIASVSHYKPSPPHIPTPEPSTWLYGLGIIFYFWLFRFLRRMAK